MADKGERPKPKMSATNMKGTENFRTIRHYTYVHLHHAGHRRKPTELPWQDYSTPRLQTRYRDTLP